MHTASGSARAVPVVAALAATAAAAWGGLLAGVVEHPSHAAMLGSGTMPSPGALLSFLGRWQVMVAAMMLPATAVGFAAAVWPASPRRQWLAAAASVATTCVVWAGFAVVALAADSWVHYVVHSSAWLDRTQSLATAAVLVLAGGFQLSAGQQRCLAAASRALAHPARHAVAFLGGCWAPMFAAFAVAAGSRLWMAVLTVMMTALATRHGPWLARVTGLGMVTAGVLAAVVG